MDNLVTRLLEFPVGDSTGTGYFAAPGDEEDHPAVVLIHEKWGLVSQIADYARRFARAGYFALAPDLYHGKATSDSDEAQQLALELDRAAAIGEILGAANALVNMPRVVPNRVGLVGWSMGGGLACSAAARDDAGLVGAVVVFYGRPAELEETSSLRAPLLGLYGAEDEYLGADWVSSFGSLLAQAGKSYHLELYPNAPHGFFDDARPSYRQAAAQDAWRLTLEWMKNHLSR